MGVLQEQPAPRAGCRRRTKRRWTTRAPLVPSPLARSPINWPCASASYGSHVVNIGRYIQRAGSSEEDLTGAQATATVPADEQVSSPPCITDNQGRRTSPPRCPAA